ncbi:MATE family efflux transporter [Holdemania filiformis]|uniref:MATE family efflux transporter n=1 Tax=Holdemania filiformis TaxID=61171 RepID=A0A412FZB3_9FIRM|nr:MATE family efflux transporter [Holdemania filiformis]MBS5000248.1 MATE family efflux transporter [Holdemania filiformis]RGR73498.1 MATE family efflux transporter [Holdemania filiformis]
MSKFNSDKMGTMPVGKLLFSMSVPAIFSMLVQSLYNVVDSIFVAQVSEDALVAVSIAFPLQMLIIALALGVGVGTNALIARRLGEKRREEANIAANTGIVLSLINMALCMLVGLFLAKPFVGLFTQDAAVFTMGSQYLMIVMVFSVGVMIEMTCSRVLQATGNMIVPMISQLIGAITNIILDPIFIFGYFGVPKMGVAGAAVATVIGQILAMIFVLIVLKVGTHEVDIAPWRHHPQMQAAKDIYRVGIPTFVMNAIGSLTTTAMNAILMSFSATAVAVLGIYFKLQSFVFMPIFGLNQGAMPILGYNYGAADEKRFTRTLALSFGVALAIMVIGTVLFWTMPEMLLKLFNGSDQMLQLGSYALRVLALCFLPAACSIIMTTMFQALGKGMMSLVMSLLRQLVFIIPLAWMLGQLGGLGAVWFCYPAAELLVAVIFVPIALKTIKKSFDQERQETGVY